MRITLTFLVVTALVCGVVGVVRADATMESPRLLVHLLDYLANDYAGAVSDGKVINATEYREQVEFVRAAAAMSRKLPELRDHRDIVGGIDTLAGLIANKGYSADVAMLARQLKVRVIQVSRIAESPARWPSLAHGATLYSANCVACHGVRGAGDGPAAAMLDPKPVNFLDEQIGQNITPFRAFNAIRVGIPGTTMTAWPALSDSDTWDLAFYVTSLHINGSSTPSAVSAGDLAAAATHPDRELMSLLPGGDAEKRAKIAALRLHSVETPSVESQPPRSDHPNTLTLARDYLSQAGAAYAAGDIELADRAALLAYLEGIEPVEPQLRAYDANFVTELEGRMAAVRSAIGSHRPLPELQALIASANQIIDAAAAHLGERAAGPWVTFVLTAGILLREGFEAVLILIALLAVIRASGSTRAARWVHGGWATALGVGVLAWFFSGWVMAFSGAQREMLEGVTAILAVAVLLYIGFWLHSRTEISRWKHFIEVQVKTLLHGSNLWGLAGLAFMAVFREAFETVLFMRAITLEGGASGMRAMALGVLASFVGLIALSWLLLKYSAKLPIRKIFALSSALMVILAVILTGKGLHALQETGTIPVTVTPWRWTTDVLGVYATWETVLAQVFTIALIVGLWRLGSRPAARLP